MTLVLFDNATERIHREAQAMYQVVQDSQDNYLYRFSFLLEPEIASESIVYQISLDSRIVDTGSLTQ